MEEEEGEDPSPLKNTKTKKQPLSQTYSLPVTIQEQLGVSERSNKPTLGSQEKQEKSPKSWSFGNMAKAVGCGVTAFGSGVVHGSLAVAQATGSGVIHSSKAVGEGVVQGTKAVGEGVIHGTKAVGEGVFISTKAAGRATIAAGTGVVCGVSAIGSTTVLAGKASVTAVQDTTKWMITRTESILGECQVHIVLPDEKLEDICKKYNIEPVHLIKANNLQKRELRVGKKLLIPNSDNLAVIKRLQHEKDMLQVNAKENSLNGSLTFTYESLFFSSPSVFIEIKNCDIEEISICYFNRNEFEMPDLLRPETVSERKLYNEGNSSSITDEIPSVLVKTVEGLSYEYIVDKNDISEIVMNCKLWYPMEKFKTSLFYNESHKDETNFCLDVVSIILSENLIGQIYNQLPINVQISRWQKIFCSTEDGYSLQNFYRKTSILEEPFLLVISDKSDQIFGAFLTCTPKITDSFIGTGEMWLFSVEEEKLRIYHWSKKNDFFFQGHQSCFVIGSSNGKFGIYVDSDFNKGRIQSCETFIAWPKEEKDFVVKYFECWNFV